MTKTPNWQAFLSLPLSSLSSLSHAPSVRRRVARAIGGNHLRHLLLHTPRRFIDYSHPVSLNQLQEGARVSVCVRVIKHHAPPRITRHTPYRIECSDAHPQQSMLTQSLTVIFFRGTTSYIKNQLPQGAVRYLGGRVTFFRGKATMAHPEWISSDPHGQVRSVYGGVGHLPRHHLAVKEALALCPECPDWRDAPLTCKEALQQLHEPHTSDTLNESHTAWQRLAYDELLARRLAFALNERQFKESGRALPDAPLPSNLTIPFNLTDCQKSALDAITTDLISDKRMLRLLQGDVGSGKTIVALLAMLKVALAGYQAALMAPTTLLATQTARIAARMATPLGIATHVLHGGDTAKTRQKKQLHLLHDKKCLIFGTHALFQKKTHFANLALIVIDEQQRFGVAQRLELYKKTHQADVLAMTATPIPRSLWLAQEGTLDVSVLRTKPAGRKKIQTLVKPMTNHALNDIMHALQKTLAQGQLVYWVCPLIDDDDSAAKNRAAWLEHHLPDTVALLHGSMNARDKQSALQSFSSGDKPLLVSTTVIEVGIDVATANVMVVEKAESFGLSQLHQLRGRIGRSGDAAFCIFLYAPPLSLISKQRLAILRDEDDGFVIAEKDLELRGSGDPLGVQQSGTTRWRFFHPARHKDMTQSLHEDVTRLLNGDAERYRPLLALFQDQADDSEHILSA